jgi:nitrite reductase/ring-hydroxylating ferredoxin subunit
MVGLRIDQNNWEYVIVMAGDVNWVDIGSADELSGPPLRRIKAANRELAISLKDWKFGAVSNTCNHAGGPLGEGRLDGDYIVCPWHNWKFHRRSGVGEPVSSKTAFPPTR